MAIILYNSLTKKKEELSLQAAPLLTMYSCGVTVYDDCHIGHARSLYIFEVIRRYLKYRGYTVRFVRNITDIDDKIINRANELKVDWKDLVEKYIARYYEDMQSLGIPRADFEPRATHDIEAMTAYIGTLIEKGFAYATETGVYFNVRKFPSYGRLSGQSIEAMLTGVRKEADESKQDPLDFALWKASKPGEPSWPSPWGAGRPGWHIECSVMSTKYLQTDTIDIHAGGRDLIFPHHENEIAQAEALTGKPFATQWIHHGLLTINGQKMSKSLGNFVTIKDFLARHKYADILKVLFLSAHYSHPVDYTDDKIEEAKQALTRIRILLDKVTGIQEHRDTGKKFKGIEEIKNRFVSAMDDDFNTPQGLGAIFELVNLANKNIGDADFMLCAKDALEELMGLFGLNFRDATTSPATADVLNVKGLIEKRLDAKKKRDFKEADKIRKELELQGIILEDTKDGTTWRRKL
jgi:cysteinyl-tRNA synthetase